ncbi:MAG TPA: DUF1295 domain-containing protein [Candidatus Hydrogenedentes bacterium]|nr:DUF1295 domain-containing protein [Candidatus Hydrogenedentota bacterium]
MLGPIETNVYHCLALLGVLSGLAVFFILFLISAPYGRHTRAGWGPSINSRWGWILMEFPSPFVFLICYVYGNGGRISLTVFFAALWLMHYFHRVCIFPFRIHEQGKRTPLLIVFFAILFNTFNGYLNGRYLGVYADEYPWSWCADPRFVLGLFLFVAGVVINLHSDQILLNLRAPGEIGYKIPYGGLYRWLSCPNYFGELLEWTGWAIATWSLPGAVFAFWTAANLVPRAHTHHLWYHQQFPEYPPERCAVLPFLF